MDYKFTLQDDDAKVTKHQRPRSNFSAPSKVRNAKLKHKAIEYGCSVVLLCICCPISILCCCIKLPSKICLRGTVCAKKACCGGSSDKKIYAGYSSFSDIEFDFCSRNRILKALVIFCTDGLPKDGNAASTVHTVFGEENERRFWWYRS
ncbi:hypothetical protein ACFE04_021772 [Oxalis oulophora]